MQSSETEERVVPMTEADIALSEKAIEEAYEKIGEIAVKKAKANAIASADTKAETKIVDRETKKLETGEHRVACYVEKDLHEGKARYYRADTLLWVYTRDLENWERQQPLTFETGPATNTASEAAKKKSPGLKAQEPTETQKHVAKELHDNFGPVLAGEVIRRTATDGAEAALKWGIAEKLRRDAAATAPAVPDEVRAAVVEAGVPDENVDAAIVAIRDGADPATVIHNAKRAGGAKVEKPAKVKAEKKPKKSKAAKDKGPFPLDADETEDSVTLAPLRSDTEPPQHVKDAAEKVQAEFIAEFSEELGEDIATIIGEALNGNVMYPQPNFPGREPLLARGRYLKADFDEHPDDVALLRAGLGGGWLDNFIIRVVLEQVSWSTALQEMTARLEAYEKKFGPKITPAAARVKAAKKGKSAEASA